MIYEKEVKELLGAEVYKTANSGEISAQQMADIAFELHEKVGGDFKRARENKSFKCDRTAAARTVLSSLILPKDKRTNLSGFLKVTISR